MVDTLNRLGGQHGIGISDIVENRLVGMKSRGVYETPGGTILYHAHNTMDKYSIFRDLAIILVTAKCFGLLARRCKAPQVAGEIVAGLLIGPSVLGFVQSSDFMAELAEIGVILLMFSAGLTTELKKLVKTHIQADDIEMLCLSIDY